jgi:hypothetical protein
MATSQPMKATVSMPRRGVTQFLLVAAALALIVTLAVSFAFAGRLAGESSGTTVDRAASDALIQFRANERHERYAPSVEEIRKALIQQRTSERDER